MTNRQVRRFNPLKDRRGTAFMSFALVAPMFFLIILGIIDFGMMMWTSNTVEHAATEATRYAAVRGSNKASPATETQVKTVVQNRADGITIDPNDITVTWANGSNNPGSSVSVLVTIQYDYIIGGLMNFDPVQLEGTSTMIVN